MTDKYLWSIAVGIAFIAATLSGCSGASPNEELFQNARSACAQMGFRRNSPEIGTCAADMMAKLQNPQQ